MARSWYWGGVDARVRRRGAAGRARRYLARRVGAERAGAGLLPQVEVSSGRPARVSVGLRPTKGHRNAARGIDRLLARGTAELALAGDSPSGGFVVELRGRAAV